MKSPFKFSLFVPAILTILFLSIFFRFYNFSNNPSTLYIDEVAILVDAKSLVTSGKDIHSNHWFQPIFISYGDYKMPVFIWSVYFFSKIFGVSNFMVRFPNLLAGLITILATVGISLSLFKEDKAIYLNRKLLTLTSLIVIGLSPWAIQFSRTGFEAFFGQMLLAVSIWIIIVSKKRWSFLFLSVIVASLATYTYFSVRYVWVPTFIIWSILNVGSFKEGQLFKKSFFELLKLLLPLFIFVLLMLPMYKSNHYQDSIQFRYSTPSVLQIDKAVLDSNEYKEISNNILFSKIYFHRYHFVAKDFLRNLSDQLSLNFLFITGDQNLRHGTGKYGLFLFPFVIPFFLGIYSLVKKNKKNGLILFVWIFFSAFPAAVPYEVPHALRFLNALIPISIIISIGLFELIYFFINSTLLSKFYRYLMLFLYFIITTFYIGAYANYYFDIYPKESQNFWFKNELEVAANVIPYISDDQKLVLLNMPEKEFLWLMAYGPYSGSEFHTWSSNNYQFNNFANVSNKLPTDFNEDMIVIYKNEIDLNAEIFSNYSTVLYDTFETENNDQYKIVDLKL